jgi:photosystem II stability/assembly factor-like uncharacterized protein
MFPQFAYRSLAAVSVAAALAFVAPARADEAPPRTRDPAIAAALDRITPAGVTDYIQYLQNFKSRDSYMPGCEQARDYIRETLTAAGYRTWFQEFRGVRLGKACWGDDDRTAWVLTAGSTLYNTVDGGDSWQRQVTSAPGHVYDVHFVDASVGYAASGTSTVARTEDGGKTWTNFRVDKGAEDIMRAVFFIDRDVGWAACDHGSSPRIYGTVDGGAHWAGQNLPEYGCPHIIAFGNSQRGWAVPNWYEDNAVYRTEDGGAKWTAQAFPVCPAEVRSFVALSGDIAWAAYGGSRLIYTRDGGASWQYKEVAYDAALTTVSFANAYVGYAGGDGVIYKTEDGGSTWLELLGVPDVFCGDLAFGDADHGLVVDLFGDELYVTGDGGASFERIDGRLDMFWENVIAECRGSEAPDEIVILGAHYDSASDRPVDGAPGADANASGASCVLAAAAAFRDLPTGRTLRFVFFGGAEQSYLGSRAYAHEASAKDENVVAAVILDMVGYDEDGGRRDDAIVRLDGNSIWVGDYAAAVAALYEVGLIFDYDMTGYPGDHCSFWETNYDAVGLFEGGPGAEANMVYPYYHTDADTLDKLTVPLAVRVAKAAAAIAGHLARSACIGVEDPRAAAANGGRRRPWAVYPNPYRYGSAAGVTFRGVAAPATITVFDIAGRKIARCDVAPGCEDYVWKPAPRGGDALAPGVYVYRVEGKDQLRVGKLVVAGR